MFTDHVIGKEEINRDVYNVFGKDIVTGAVKGKLYGIFFHLVIYYSFLGILWDRCRFLS